jgi:hypothetical protein
VVEPRGLATPPSPHYIASSGNLIADFLLLPPPFSPASGCGGPQCPLHIAFWLSAREAITTASESFYSLEPRQLECALIMMNVYCLRQPSKPIIRSDPSIPLQLGHLALTIVPHLLTHLTCLSCPPERDTSCVM